MVAKVRIIEHLGHGGLLVPRLVRAALEADDRAKIRMTALQAAAASCSPVGAEPPSSAPTRAGDLAASAGATEAEETRRRIRGIGERGGHDRRTFGRRMSSIWYGSVRS